MPKTRSDFEQGYIDTLLWCGVYTEDESGELTTTDELDDLSSIPESVLATIKQDCESFISANREMLDETEADDYQHGTDFYLTRNRHGAGFWDRGYGEVGRKLTDAAHTYGEFSLSLDNDGNVSEMN